MSLLNEEIKSQLKESFEKLEGKVKLLFFTEILRCQYCKETESLYEDVASLSDKIELEVRNLHDSKDLVEKYNLMEMTPATIILGENDKDYGIRFYGIPAGYEFSSFIETIMLVSTGKHNLKEETVDFLKNLEKEVELKIFVTTSCPYCPSAVILGHQFAYVSDKVKSNMIEVAEFPHLGNKYNVMGVPRTVINEVEFQEGAAPEEMIIEKIKSVL